MTSNGGIYIHKCNNGFVIYDDSTNIDVSSEDISDVWGCEELASTYMNIEKHKPTKVEEGKYLYTHLKKQYILNLRNYFDDDRIYIFLPNKSRSTIYKSEIYKLDNLNIIYISTKIEFYGNPGVSSISNYKLKQNSNKTWSSVIVKYTGYNGYGKVENNIIYEPKQNRDGSWTSVIAKSIYYKYEDNQINEKIESIYEAKQNRDGSWMSVKIKEIVYYGNEKGYEYIYELKQDKNHNYISLKIKMLAFYLGTNKLWGKEVYEVKENKDGSWISLLKYRFYYSKNGKLEKKEVFKIYEQNGKWYSALSNIISY